MEKFLSSKRTVKVCVLHIDIKVCSKMSGWSFNQFPPVVLKILTNSKKKMWFRCRYLGEYNNSPYSSNINIQSTNESDIYVSLYLIRFFSKTDQLPSLCWCYTMAMLFPVSSTIIMCLRLLGICQRHSSSTFPRYFMNFIWLISYWNKLKQNCQFWYWEFQFNRVLFSKDWEEISIFAIGNGSGNLNRCDTRKKVWKSDPWRHYDMYTRGF
jgi:hypothetical protein